MPASIPPDVVPIVVANRALILSRGVQEVLRDHAPVHLVGTAARIEDALHLLEGHSAAALIVDSDLIAAASKQTLNALARVRVVVLVNDLDDRWPQQVAAVPAAAYLTMDADRDDLVRAVTFCDGGRILMQAALPREQAAHLFGNRGKGRGRSGRRPDLSNREIAVLRWLSDGSSDQQVARRLGIGLATVKSHVRSVLRKTRSRNRTSAVAWGFRSGVLS